jgi:hypothetical protein
VGDVIDLAYHRALRSYGVRSAVAAPARQLTRAEKLDALSRLCVVVDALNGYELAGVPTAQMVEHAGIDKDVWARLREGHWYWVSASDVAWQQGQG